MKRSLSAAACFAILALMVAFLQPGGDSHLRELRSGLEGFLWLFFGAAILRYIDLQQRERDARRG